MDKYIPLSQCKKGYLYRLWSRNLDFGVFDGKGGFIGIRQKFGQQYLFTEFHWDMGAPYGTVQPIEEIEQLPSHIIPVEDFGTIDEKTGRQVEFDGPIKAGGRGWYFIDTNEASTKIKPTSSQNKDLFNYLKKFDDNKNESSTQSNS